MNSIGYANTSFSQIAFWEEGNDDAPIMELSGSYSSNGYAMRVPNIGETVILASYEHDRTNDKAAIFRDFYKVVDVITHYSENKAYKNVSVQYSVTVKKEIQ